MGLHGYILISRYRFLPVMREHVPMDGSASDGGYRSFGRVRADVVPNPRTSTLRTSTKEIRAARHLLSYEAAK